MKRYKDQEALNQAIEASWKLGLWPHNAKKREHSQDTIYRLILRFKRDPKGATR